ncbi:MAG: glycosyltransferase [Phycisphaerales bacterium]|nr:glycosyltransferase [Phycisphaerales bacterium]
MLSRLEIGLADEGLRVLHAVPNEIIETESVGVYSSPIGYDDRGFPTTVRARVRELVAAIERATDAEPAASVDFVHSFGPGCERLAIELAAELRAAALIEVWQTASFGAAAEAFRRDRANVTILVPDSRLLQSFRSTHRDCEATEAPWGVHASPQGSTGVAGGQGEQAPALALLAECSHLPILESALKGIADAVNAEGSDGLLKDLMVFVDADRVRSPRLWQAARKHGLLDRLSIVPRAEARREPILHLDALLVPEPTGRFRSIVLDAMARGIPVIASNDPSISVLSDPSIARLVTPATPAAWSAAVREMLPGTDARQRLVAAAREFVRGHRTASAHVAAVLRAYEAAHARRNAAPSVVR